MEVAAPVSGGIVERAVLEDLAAASRILADQGVFDAAGHVSMRHPHHAERFLMSRSLAPALVSADDIMEFTLRCEPCDGGGRRPFIERFLHGPIYQARPDVMAIAHGHSASVIPFGLVETPMRATYHNAAFLAAGVPVFDIRERFGATDIVISSAERGAALAAALGDKSVVLLRAHGVVVVGPSLQAAVFRAVFTEVSARVQLQAAVLGGPIAALDAEEGRQADAVNLATLDSILGSLEETGHVVKQQLVDAIRMLERAAIIDHNGHCSARRDASTFYINSGASVRGALTVDDIVTVDLDGSLVEGSARPPLEFHIHSEIYRARPDVNVVMHTHPQWSTFLTMTGVPFKPVYAQGVLLGDMPLMDSPLSVNTRPMGETLAATLGRGPAALLKAHGAVIVGADIVECFALAAYVEENAYRQYMAMQIGDPYVFSEAEQRACREKLWSPGLFKKTWDHYYSKLK